MPEHRTQQPKILYRESANMKSSKQLDNDEAGFRDISNQLIDHNSSPLFIKLRKQFQPWWALVTGAIKPWEPTEGHVLTQTNHVDHQDTKLEWNKCKVDALHKRPNHQIGLVGGTKCALPPFYGIDTFHHSHRGQEAGELYWGKNDLIGGDTGGGGGCGAIQINVTLEDTKPFRGDWTEDS